MNSERLLKLADFLKTVHENKWDYSDWTNSYEGEIHKADPLSPNECETTACALGWCPVVFPQDWSWHRRHGQDIPLLDGEIAEGWLIEAHAAKFFDISHVDASLLFCEQSDEITAQGLALIIEEFVDDREETR